MTDIPPNCTKRYNDGVRELNNGRPAAAIALLQEAREAHDPQGLSRSTSPAIELARGMAWRELGLQMQRHRDDFAWRNTYPPLFVREDTGTGEPEINAKRAFMLSLKCLSEAHRLKQLTDWSRLETPTDFILLGQTFRERARTYIAIGELFTAQQNAQSAVVTLQAAQNRFSGSDELKRITLELSIAQALHFMIRHVARCRPKSDSTEMCAKLALCFDTMFENSVARDEEALRWMLRVGIWQMQTTPFRPRAKLAIMLLTTTRGLPQSKRGKPMAQIFAALWGLRRFP